MAVRALNPGEWRLRLDASQASLAQHLLQIAVEHPARFGGLDELGRETQAWRSRCIGLRRGLYAGETVLTLPQRELLHTVLAEALAQPELFGNMRRNLGLAQRYLAMVRAIQEKLPRRGAGTY